MASTPRRQQAVDAAPEEDPIAFEVPKCLERLSTRNPGRTEADIHADVREVLLFGDFFLADEQVRLESPAPDRRRIDVEVGALGDVRDHRSLGGCA